MFFFVINNSYECVGDSRLRCDLVDLYYTLFGTRKPLCFLDDFQQQQQEEAASRRKSILTTREGVDEFKRVCLLIFSPINNYNLLLIFYRIMIHQR